MVKRPRYTQEFKDSAIADGLETTFTEAAKKHSINSAMLGRWSRERKQKGNPKSHKPQLKLPRLEALMETKIAELQEKIEVFRKALALIKTI